MITLAFDVYGTLIDTDGVVRALSDHVGARARRFAGIWRRKQLEYSFRRGLMARYKPFPVCTRQALDYTCKHLEQNLSDSVREELMACYRRLPAFDDVAPALQAMRRAGHRLYAFSNGARDDVLELLRHGGIEAHFHGVVSVEDVQSFKPDPMVYAHFLRAADTDAAHCWLVSGNAFDVIGARGAGWSAAWLKRDPKAVFDPWDIQPTAIISALPQLSEVLPVSGCPEAAD